MQPALDLLRHERRARVFLAVVLQSALGTGAGYVALLLIAHDRYESPWAISLVLLAELLPAMLLGPLFGALADRWSRKNCMVLADSLRALAFVGVVLVDSFEATVLLAGLAGIGTGLFNPSVLAALASVVDEPRRVPAVSSLYGVAGDFGYTGGFALSATLLLLLGGPVGILLVTAATFAVSALALSRLRFGASPDRPDDGHPAFTQEIVEGVRATVGMRDVRTILIGSAAGLVCIGVFNVTELLFLTEELGASDAGFSLLVMCFAIGFVGGSISASRGGAAATFKRRYLLGVLLLGVGMVATGTADNYVLVAITLACIGCGNGLLLVYERLLIQVTVSDHLIGRVFGAKDALTAWAFGIAFLIGGVLVSEWGPRGPILLSGGVAIAIYLVLAVALRGEWSDDVEEAPLDGRADAVGADVAVGGQDGADVIGRRREGIGVESLDHPH